MSLEWLLIRGSGLAAFVLLAMAVLWGLLISTRVLGRAAGAKPVTWFHESLSIGALVAAAVHAVALGLHDFVDFTWTEVFVPGVAAWRPVAVAFGVVAFYALAVITLSFYLKPLIGQRAWRALHTLSFGVYVAALAHGLLAGTDRAHPAVVAMYAALTAATVLLIAIRVSQSLAPAPAARRPPATVPAASAAGADGGPLDEGRRHRARHASTTSHP